MQAPTVNTVGSGYYRLEVPEILTLSFKSRHIKVGSQVETGPGCFECGRIKAVSDAYKAELQMMVALLGL